MYFDFSSIKICFLGTYNFWVKEMIQKFYAMPALYYTDLRLKIFMNIRYHFKKVLIFEIIIQYNFNNSKSMKKLLNL